MRLEATVMQLIEDGGELSVAIHGWAETDPAGISPRPLGTINIPANEHNRSALYIGRELIIDVKPV